MAGRHVLLIKKTGDMKRFVPAYLVIGTELRNGREISVLRDGSRHLSAPGVWSDDQKEAYIAFEKDFRKIEARL